MIHDLAAQLLELDEGRKRFSYGDTCPEAFTTIGVGRNIDYRGGRGLRDDEIDYMLNNDISAAIFDLCNMFENWQRISEARQAVLISMWHALDHVRFMGFQKMIAAVRAEDWERAADEMVDSKFYREAGERGPRLERIMRKGEIKL